MPGSPPTRSDGPVGRVFFVAWSALLVAAYVSVGWQWSEVFGGRGMFPITQTARMDSLAWPSLVALWPAEGLAKALWGVGLLASVGSWWPAWRGVAFGVSAACWWQLSVSSPLVLGLPPDILLLHGTVAAALLATPSAAWAGRWLAWGVLSKLYLEAGLSKLVYDGSAGVEVWLGGAFSSSFFEVVAVPGPLARGWHGLLGPWALAGGAVLVVVIQVGGGLAVWTGRRGRLLAFVGFTGLQVFLITTANFGVLCWGSLALGLTLLLDPLPAPPRRWRRVETWVLGVWVVGNVAQVSSDLTGWGGDAVGYTALRGWRVAHRYTMFMQVPDERVDWRFSVRDPSGTWRDVALPGQLDPAATHGRFLGPHHPRLAFMLWFSGAFEGGASRAVADAFDAPEVLVGEETPARRGVAEARAWASYVCRGRSPDAEVRLSVRRVGFAPSGPGWWRVEELARSRAVPCASLEDAPLPWVVELRRWAGAYR